jgi:hypothetical protein
MEKRQRFCRTRLALNRDKDAAAARERVEDAPIMGLKSDAPHRAGQSQLGQVAALALKRLNERTTRDHRANPRQLEPFSRRPKRAFEEADSFGTVFGHNAQRLGGKSCVVERRESLLRPRDILEHAHCESSFIHTDHAV